MVKYSLWGGEKPEITDLDAVMEELKSQTLDILPFSCGRLYAFGLNAEQTKKYTGKWGSSVHKYGQILAAEKELTRLLGEHGIKPVVIKGTSAGIYYPDPKCRRYGDIDFLPSGGSVEETCEIMQAAGYEFSHEYDEQGDLANPRHICLHKDGIEFELHRIIDSDADEDKDVIGDLIRASEPQKHTLDGVDFYSPSDDENGIALIWHIRHHLSTGIGLRQFTDWMMYVDKYLTDEKWNAGFAEKARKCALETLAVHATRMCELYLGLPHRAFSEAADDALCEQLLEDVLDNGNFGRNKDYLEYRVEATGKYKNIFERLQKGGLSRWKATWKHRWLRPFAWIYQLFYVIGQLLKRPAETWRMGRYRKARNKRKKMLESLSDKQK